MSDKRNVLGLSHERLYSVYNGMIQRCYNSDHPHYNNWGGRGIKVCDEWRYNYQEFRKWALSTGYDKNKDRKYQSLDRINNDGDYCPENCRWATMKEQNNNQRPRKRGTGYKYNWTFEGVTKSAEDWCEIFNVSVPMVMYRVNKKGMKPFVALTTPVTRSKNVYKITKEQVMELREKGMTQKQIADMLGCSVKTVRKRMIYT